MKFSLEQLQELCDTADPYTSPHCVGTRAKESKRAESKRRIFTLEEDELLVDLKENQGLSWKDIEQRFQNRGMSSLQVHYSTELSKEYLHLK